MIELKGLKISENKVLVAIKYVVPRDMEEEKRYTMRRNIICMFYARFWVIMAATTNITVFIDSKLRGLVLICHCFIGTYVLQLEDILKMEVADSSETLVELYKTTQWHISEVQIFYLATHLD